MTARARGRGLALASGAVVFAGIVATYRAQHGALFGDVLALLVVVSGTCALLGSWLVLRRMAMMADAIAHAILFGIAVVLVVWSAIGGRPDLGSPVFILGAALSGVLTVALVEALLGTGRVRSDAAIGLVFSLLFAVAVLTIGLRFRDAHVDEHVVLAGGVEVTVLRQVIVDDVVVPPALAFLARAVVPAASLSLEPGRGVAPDASTTLEPGRGMVIRRWRVGPRALYTMLVALALSLLFVAALRKELALTTFDPALAAALGFAPVVLNYALMGLVSVTAVAAFEAVGSIIVIALFLAPPAAAFLLTEDVVAMQIWAVVLGLLSAWLGFLLGLRLDANFGGSAATVSGIVFAACFLGAPRQGVIAVWWRRRRQTAMFDIDLLLVHVANHQDTPWAVRETARDALGHHLRWAEARVARVLAAAEHDDLATVDTDGRVRLTVVGRARSQLALDLGTHSR